MEGGVDSTPPVWLGLMVYKLFEIISYFIVTKVSPEVASSISKHKFIPSPDGGVAGLLFTSLWSSANLAPLHGFRGPSSYPAIGGVTRLEGKYCRRFLFKG